MPATIAARTISIVSVVELKSMAVLPAAGWFAAFDVSTNWKVYDVVPCVTVNVSPFSAARLGTLALSTCWIVTPPLPITCEKGVVPTSTAIFAPFNTTLPVASPAPLIAAAIAASICCGV